MKRTLSTSALLLALVTTLSSAHAGLPSPLDIKRDIDRRIERDVRHLDLVPARLLSSQRTSLRPYFVENVFERRHQHFHSIYRFPVQIGGRVVYRPYTYCNDELLYGVTLGLPFLAVQIQVPVIPSREIVYRRGYKDDRYSDRCRYDRGCSDCWRREHKRHRNHDCDRRNDRRYGRDRDDD